MALSSKKLRDGAVVEWWLKKKCGLCGIQRIE
jgi:hypothetical protein